ncbi:GNAT family N-acetyltransferase [Bradyrhizobium arachidis]|uniref:GNAT family N-acetyltransferase n=1 Tax=Bradyrhizobium TaxID=374 RepID=UPI00188CF435|nr:MULTISPECIES: GNAT family N-acetyltransferase [Bradyrhizobium]MDN4982195.1 GNAT family N-acetyltransferase [Bradyrhizobium sp. WYCCWR 13022]QOZ53302.1 GNAT family N-acetyltransferase [Bradyrhizobium sp. CCBAU 53338]UVO33709.1 GNAT family N-acetyltransferase [Bradyrhizobium arachidis]
MEIKQDDPKAPHVAALLAHHLEELRSVMGEHAQALDASGLSAPSVTFWTAWQDDMLAGFGALKQLDATHGEVKSMRAAPAVRRTGAGRSILNHIIAESRKRGYSRLSLETGTAPLHVPAVALYRSVGFVSCAPFADYQASAHNQFLSLDLSR